MKRGASIVAVCAALAVVFWIFPAFHVVSLKQAQAEKAARVFNAADFAAQCWRERLAPALDKAPAAATVLAALNNDPKAATTNFGRTVGMSDTTYYLMRGAGTIVSLNGGVGIVLRSGATEPELLLKTGLLFGNTVRDASGLFQPDEFQNSKEFNDVSTELNRIVEAQVIPVLKTNATVGRMVRFVVCAEVTEDDAGERPLKAIPVRVEFP